MMLTGVKEEGQASTTNNANLSVVTTLSGLVARYVLQALEKLVLQDLKVVISRGCNMCGVTSRGCNMCGVRWQTQQVNTISLSQLNRYMRTMSIHN